MSELFEPIAMRGVTARNRIWVAPMCQYSCFAGDGMPTDWHLVHLGARATGGFGLVMAEATAVVPEGRISAEDTGLWSDDHIEPWRRIATFLREQGAVPAIQLAHAGRKASTHSPFAAADGTLRADEGGWPIVSSTSSPFADHIAPRVLSADDLAAVPEQFAAAAVRAERAGFEAVEIHAAHGYLLHQFLSPLVNDRQDGYGGSFERRIRIVLDVIDAVRAAVDDDRAVLLRLSATDWADGGWDVEQSAALAVQAAQHGVDLVDVSSGGAVPEQQVVAVPHYQVPFAERVRAGGVPVAAVGLITEPAEAEKVLASGSADAVMLGRAALREPGWPQRAAHELGISRDSAPYPPQYRRGAWY